MNRSGSMWVMVGGVVGAMTSVASAGSVAALPGGYYLAPVGAIVALVMAWVFYRTVMAKPEGEPEMVRVAAAVREGAYAYLKRQWKVVAWVFVGLVIVLLIIGFGLELQPKLTALGVPIAGFLSGLCGFFGMRIATNASSRTAMAAKQSLNDGLTVAFRAGAVMGLCVTGFALLDVSVWFFILTQIFGDQLGGLTGITTITLSFAMGASLQALFARVGGGIYTKAADVGADLVGKVEAGIPEDDARNPAVIADNVGDNVGDVAGMGADLYESYYGSILAAMALAAAVAYRLWPDQMEPAIRLVSVAPALAGVGILAAVIGIFAVRTREGASMVQLLMALRTGIWLSSALIIIGSGLILYFLTGGLEGVSWWGIWISILAGLLAGLIIAWATEFYTSYNYPPTQQLAEQSQTGPATVILAGFATGMRSTWLPVLTTVAAILVAFIAAGGSKVFLLGVFGVALAAVGMLSTLAITLSTDAYGPIADNAGGNAEMTHQPAFVRQRTDMLDSLGNTTAATGKGFAIGSAALTALALLAAYTVTVQSSLTDQVRRDTSVEVQAAVETATMAYMGNGLFKVSPKGKATVDAGLLLQPDKRADIDQVLKRGQMVPANYDEKLGVFEVELRGADGSPLKFEVATASTASLQQLLQYYNVTLMNPRVLSGLLIGVMMVFLFCAMTLNAVGRAAYKMMLEARRQFEIMRKGFRAQGMSEQDVADPTKWPFEVVVDGHRYPDYANCVAISTAGAQREMIVPSLMAVIVPIVVGLILGVPGVMGLLAGALVAGFAVAVFMANAGAAWDNAKKYIETGQLGGKGSPQHKASVVGDTVGDPFKDTSGPSLNILIKLISIVSVVFAGLIIKYSPIITAWLHLD